MCLLEGRINGRQLSVHHIIPIRQDPERKMDDDNLITLCHDHHEEVEGNPVYVGLLSRLAVTPPARILDEVVKKARTGLTAPAPVPGTESE